MKSEIPEKHILKHMSSSETLFNKPGPSIPWDEDWESRASLQNDVRKRDDRNILDSYNLFCWRHGAKPRKDSDEVVAGKAYFRIKTFDWPQLRKKGKSFIFYPTDRPLYIPRQYKKQLLPFLMEPGCIDLRLRYRFNIREKIMQLQFSQFSNDDIKRLEELAWSRLSDAQKEEALMNNVQLCDDLQA